MTPPLLDQVRHLLGSLQAEMRSKHKRRVPIGDLLQDRWQTAKDYGFGEGTSCYDNVLILGNVVVGRETWIGPNVVLDGSGGLVIGDHVSISAGAHIYTHDTVAKATSFGRDPIVHAPTRIGSGVYIGPHSVIVKGVTVGDGAVIGAMSFVNRDVAAEARVWGTPARPH